MKFAQYISIVLNIVLIIMSFNIHAFSAFKERTKQFFGTEKEKFELIRPRSNLLDVMTQLRDRISRVPELKGSATIMALFDKHKIPSTSIRVRQVESHERDIDDSLYQLQRKYMSQETRTKFNDLNELFDSMKKLDKEELIPSYNKIVEIQKNISFLEEFLRNIDVVPGLRPPLDKAWGMDFDRQLRNALTEYKEMGQELSNYIDGLESQQAELDAQLTYAFKNPKQYFEAPRFKPRTFDEYGEGFQAKTKVPDYYKILGVSPRATQEEIRSAYRKLAILRHPDKNPNDPDATKKFQALVDAKEVLLDPEKKAQYDRELAGR